MLQVKHRTPAVVRVLWCIACLCVAYGLSVAALATGSSFYLIWFFIAALLAVCAVMTKRCLWQKIPRCVRRVMVAVLCLGLAVFCILQGCILSGFGTAGEPDLDCIIVLGAQVKVDGPGSILRRRLQVAVAYLNDNPDTICIVSGGQGANEPWSEAQGMADYLIANGIAPQRILLEDASATTLQNLANSRALLPPGARVGIVTNNFHVFRALQMAKRLGYENVCGIAAGLSVLYLPHNMLREALAIIKFILFPG